MKKMVLIVSSLMGLLVFAGCNDDSSKNKPSPQQVEEQQNIDKYNAYVEAYNRGTSRIVSEFPGDVAILDKIISGNASSSVSLGMPSNVINGLRFFKEAKAEPGTAPELEGKVDAVIAALSEAEPTAKELKNYIENKGYLADNGEKARSLKSQYIEIMANVDKELGAFTEYLQDKEKREIKQQFESAVPDTTSYYVSGLLYYGRESLSDFKKLVNKPDDKNLQAVFEEKVNKMAELTGDWTKKDLPKFCSVPRQANGYIADARTALASFRKGNAIKSDGSINNGFVGSYYNALLGKLNATINSMNGGGCGR